MLTLTRLKPFRNVITMSIGYLFSAGSAMLMYTMLPIVFSTMRNTKIAGFIVMSMTILQIFLFGPIASNLVDTYGARKISFAYAGFFICAAVLRFGSYFIDNTLGQSITIIAMVISISMGYGSRYIDVYTLRTAPAKKVGISFGILTTMTAIGQLLANLLQPHFLGEQTQFFAPVIMIVGMGIFLRILLSTKSDLEPDPAIQFLPNNLEKLESNIKTTLRTNFLTSYGRTFYRGWRFIKHGRDFPLIPLTTSFFSGIFYGSIYFLIPLFFVTHSDYHSIGLEIGIYQIITLCFALVFGFIADKGKSMRNIMIGWSGILIAMLVLYYNPRIEMMIWIGIIVGLSDQFLYANSQYILANYDRDKANDGAYTQTRNIVSNIGYMFMPVLRGLLMFIGYDMIFKLLASIISGIAILGMIVAFYLFVVREGYLNNIKHKKKWWQFVWWNK